MSWLLNKYIRIISSRFERFKEKSHGVFQFRCPYCKDSVRNKSKARGYILTQGDRTTYFCHNCGKNISGEHFLSDMSPNDFQDYLFEKLQINKPKKK